MEQGRVQFVGGKDVNRFAHVWRRRGKDWKCVLCGGVTGVPTEDAVAERYERLTDEDRRACPVG